jgi:hypothetical protein
MDGLDPVAASRTRIRLPSATGLHCLHGQRRSPTCCNWRKPRERERCLDEQHPIPFEDLLTPFVTWAGANCARKAGAAYARFTPRAHASLERHLLQRLSAQAARSLLNAMSLEMPDDDLSLDLCLGSPSCAVYVAFVKLMLSGGLLSFFEEYSVLARVLATIAEMWVEAVAEMLARVHDDARAIGAMAGVVSDIEVTASRLRFRSSQWSTVVCNLTIGQQTHRLQTPYRGVEVRGMPWTWLAGGAPCRSCSHRSRRLRMGAISGKRRMRE